MWIVIMYICFVSGVCGFVDSPPVYSKADCQKMMMAVDLMAENDPTVSVYDSKCVQVKMMQVRRS